MMVLFECGGREGQSQLGAGPRVTCVRRAKRGLPGRRGRGRLLPQRVVRLQCAKARVSQRQVQCNGQGGKRSGPTMSRELLAAKVNST